jgi:WD40 repeat protein
MPAIFISYSGLDRTIASDVKRALERLGFERLFLDFDKVTGFGAGENWEKRLYEELSRCHAVILVVTPNWLAAKWCFAELTLARALGKIILPVVCEPIGEKFILPDLQSVDLLDWNADGLHKLERRLRAITNELARGFDLDPNRSPFPGIHAFEPEDAAIYFGRDDETREVSERLDARRTHGGARFLVVVGASGSGKSSLLKAGIVPQLSRRRREWLVLPYMRPEKAPVAALAKSIAHQIDKPDDWQRWHAHLGGPDAIDHLEHLLNDIRVGDARGATVLLPIDQLEEVFTVATPVERANFLRLLASAVDPLHDLPVMVVATGRSDVLEGTLETVQFARSTESYALLPMPLDRLPRLIEGPAQVAALSVEKGLVEAVTRDVGSLKALPLLAYTLWLLSRRRRDNNRLSLIEYHLLGDPKRHLNPIQNSVRLVADQVISGLKPTDAELAALRDAFVPQLVRVRLDDGERVRQPARLSELPRGALRVIRALVDSRLLSTRIASEANGEAKDGDIVVEVTHEALFKAWPTLDQWLTDEHMFLSDIERIKNSHDIWTQATDAQKTMALLTGLLLSRAREWSLKFPQRFLSRDMAALRVFIAVSAEVDDAEKVRIVDQRNQALITRSLFLASLSQLQREVDTGAAILLALEALPDSSSGASRPYVPEAELQLDRALRALREQLMLKPHSTAAVNSATFSPDGKRIVTASDDKTLRLWNAQSGKQIGEPLTGHSGAVNSAAFSPDGKYIVTGSSDETVRLWDAETGKQIGKPLQGHTSTVFSVAFSPDGKRITSASADKTVRLWDIESAKQIGEPLTGHTDYVARAAFSPDGKRVVTASWDGSVRLWDAESRKEIGYPRWGDTLDGVFSAAFSPNGKRIVSANGDKTVRLWDVDSGKQIGEPLIGHTESVYGAVFSPDGKYIASCSGDRTVRLWDAGTGKQIGEPLTGHTNAINSVAFSPDGMHIVTASGDKTVRLWDAEVIEQLMGEPLDFPLEWGLPGVESAAFSPDGERVVTASRDTARLWDVKRQKQIGEPLKGTLLIKSAMFSPDGMRIVAASSGGNGTVLLWDAETGKQIGEPLTGHTGAVNSAAFSPDGKYIVTGSSDETVRLWDAATGKQIGKPLQGHTRFVFSVAFSPDGKRITSASVDKTVRLWDVESGKQIGEPLIGHTESVYGAVFSPDGKYIASCSGDRTVRLWDAGTGKQIGEPLTGHTNAINSAAFSPDGMHIVTASDDKTVRLWDAQSGKQIGEPLAGHTGAVNSAAFSPDGKRIVTASKDNTARLFTIVPGGTEEIVAAAKAALPRGLTAEQRHQFSLPAEPPTWYIEQEKWPYDTLAWKEWLSDKLAGKWPPLPPAL